MSKLFGKKLAVTNSGYMFHCPGCDMTHIVYVGEGPGPKWSFNNDPVKPTFSPSILVRYPWGPSKKECVCHSFITDGKIQFLDDCTHPLKGKTVSLPDWDGIKVEGNHGCGKP